MKALRIGTRGSRLALIQSEIVGALVEALGRRVELVRIATEGDLRTPDTQPGEGVFVTAIARALAAGEVDLAVHSAKDVPLEEDEDVVTAAYPERADPRDVVVARDSAWGESGLARMASVGTDSPRRKGFLLALRPDLRVVPLHGNVDTRLRRLDHGEVDALVLAAAGLDRLGLPERVRRRLSPSAVPPAPGQGALAVQARRADRTTLRLLAALDRPDIRLAVTAERGVLEGAGGGCRAPVGALARMQRGAIVLLAAAVDDDGRNARFVRQVLPADLQAARRAGEEAGRRLLEPAPAGSFEIGAKPWPRR